jgi:hypothetical protein
MKVNLHVETVNGNPEETAELTIWLKDQIKQLPIESIEIPKNKSQPEGTGVGDAFAWNLFEVTTAREPLCLLTACRA